MLRSFLLVTQYLEKHSSFWDIPFRFVQIQEDNRNATPHQGAPQTVAKVASSPGHQRFHSPCPVQTGDAPVAGAVSSFAPAWHHSVEAVFCGGGGLCFVRAGMSIALCSANAPVWLCLVWTREPLHLTGCSVSFHAAQFHSVLASKTHFCEVVTSEKVIFNNICIQSWGSYSVARLVRRREHNIL